MAKSISDMLQEIVNLPYAKKLEGAKAMLGGCYGILTKKGFDSKQATVLLLTFLAAAVASDGKFSAQERNMLKDMFDDDLEGIVNMIDKSKFELMDQLVDSLGADDKSTFILLAIYVAAVDDTINKDELTYLVKLMQ